MVPVIICNNLTKKHKKRWEKQFKQRDQKRLLGVWRRTQDRRNKEQSGWQDATTKRRRLVHYLDEYDLIKTKNGYALAITDVYFYLHVTAPEQEIDQYAKKVNNNSSNWITKTGFEGVEQVMRRRNITATMKKTKQKPIYDKAAQRNFPDHYAFFQFRLRSDGYGVTPSIRHKPWNVLETGFRDPLTKEEPEIIPVDETSRIMQHAPFQVELGCGPSVEAGVPPLHKMHDLYSVTDHATGEYILTPNRDTVLERLLRAPSQFYKKAGVFYKEALCAPTTDFFHVLKQLCDNNIVVEPILNNNFDGFPSRVGLEENFVREFGTTTSCNVTLNDDANALLVVGSHADRRKIRRQARREGKKVIYIDPEGYETPDGFVSYPLEAPQHDDILIRSRASDVASQLQSII